jgi:hypothetical protein
MGLCTTSQDVGQAGFSFSLFHTSRNLCFLTPRRGLFYQLSLHTVQVTSLGVPKCFSKVPTAKTAKTQNNKICQYKKPRVLDIGGIFGEGGRGRREMQEANL